LRDNFDRVEQTAAVTEIRARIYELVEFLHDIEKADAFPWAKFPHRVGLHNKCVTLRRLKHAKPSELPSPTVSGRLFVDIRLSAATRVTVASADFAGQQLGGRVAELVCAGGAALGERRIRASREGEYQSAKHKVTHVCSF
jgi:hypothetical protein